MTTTIAILGTEELREEKTKAIALFLKSGYRILDIEQNSKVAAEERGAIDLLEQANLAYVINKQEEEIEPHTSVKIGAALALKVPVIFSQMPKEELYYDYLQRIASPETLIISCSANQTDKMSA